MDYKYIFIIPLIICLSIFSEAFWQSNQLSFTNGTKHSKGKVQNTLTPPSNQDLSKYVSHENAIFSVVLSDLKNDKYLLKSQYTPINGTGCPNWCSAEIWLGSSTQNASDASHRARVACSQ